jgi:hypothetical protein
VTAPTPAPIPGDAKPNPATRYVARQPILTKDEKVFGYELLFRDGVENYFRSSDPEAASRSTLDTSMLMGLDVLCDGRRAFINCTREMLLKDYITLVPSNQTVVEVLETVEADDLVMAACQRLKEAGYMIALDDFTLDDPRASHRRGGYHQGGFEADHACGTGRHDQALWTLALPHAGRESRNSGRVCRRQ